MGFNSGFKVLIHFRSTYDTDRQGSDLFQ